MFDFEGMVTAADGILGKFMPDKTERMKLAHELATQGQNHTHEITMAQLAINKVEAASKFLFVAGWRPFIGWGCGIGFIYATLVTPFLAIWIEMPPVDTELLEKVLFGMLGFGALRTYEKVKGIARES